MTYLAKRNKERVLEFRTLACTHLSNQGVLAQLQN